MSMTLGELKIALNNLHNSSDSDKVMIYMSSSKSGNNSYHIHRVNDDYGPKISI